MFPLGFIKSKPSDGAYFLQLMKWGVLQYCVIRPTTTLAAVVLNYAGLYCDVSWAPQWGHVWIVSIVSLSVTIAMYCLLQLYLPVAIYLAPQKPLLKLFAVKAVVFLTFWQATFLSVLSMLGVVKDTKYMTADDINIGIGALLETFEMMLFAFLHVRAFTYKVYKPFHDPRSKSPPPSRTPRLRSLGHAMDFRETFREIRIGCVYLWEKIRGQEPTPDLIVRRAAHYEGAFGRPRTAHGATGRHLVDGDAKPVDKDTVEPTSPWIDAEERVDVDGERQWLGLGDEYGYGLWRREKSEDLEVQIERELERRGYELNIAGHGHIAPLSPVGLGVAHKAQRSWWRNIYNRISQVGLDAGEGTTSIERKSKSSNTRIAPVGWNPGADQHLLSNYDLEDSPPQAVGLPNRNRLRPEQPGSHFPSFGEENEDMIFPLSPRTEYWSYHHRPRQQHRSSSSPNTDILITDSNLPASNSPPLADVRVHDVAPTSVPLSFLTPSDNPLRLLTGDIDSIPSLANDVGESRTRVSGEGAGQITLTENRSGILPVSVMSADTVDSASMPPLRTYRAREEGPRNSHRRDSAHHQSVQAEHRSWPPALDLDITNPYSASPTSTDFSAVPSISMSPSAPAHHFPSSRDQYQPPRGLRRNSAQIHRVSRLTERHLHSQPSPELLSPQTPQRTHLRQTPSRLSQNNTSRRMSAPLHNTPLSLPPLSRVSRHSLDNLDSNSLSRTAETSGHPSVFLTGATVEPELSRFPRMPLEDRQRSFYSHDPRTFVQPTTQADSLPSEVEGGNSMPMIFRHQARTNHRNHDSSRTDRRTRHLDPTSPVYTAHANQP